MNRLIGSNRTRHILFSVLSAALIIALIAVPCLASGNGDVAGAVEDTWTAAKAQIKTVTNNVIFPALDMILIFYDVIKLNNIRITIHINL